MAPKPERGRCPKRLWGGAGLSVSAWAGIYEGYRFQTGTSGTEDNEVATLAGTGEAGRGTER